MASPSRVFDLDLHEDLAALGELDRVADQVDEHLAQPARVADRDARHVRQHMADELEPFLLRANGQRLQQIGEVIADRERNRLELELAAFRSSRNRGCR